MRNISSAVFLAFLVLGAYVRADPAEAVPGLSNPPVVDSGAAEATLSDGGLQPLVPSGATGPWDATPSPDAGVVRSICDLFLGKKDSDTRFVGKTSIYLSASWVGGTNIAWFDQTRGGGPTTGIGAYRDWGNSTVRRVAKDGGCELDTNDAADQFRVQGGWSAGLWSTYKRAEIGPAYAHRFSPDLTLSGGANLLAHGTGTSDWGIGVSPEVRVTYADWVGLRVAGNFNAGGQGIFGSVAPQLVVEVLISKRLKEEHFP